MKGSKTMLYPRNKRRRVVAVVARHSQFLAMLRRTMVVMLPVWLVYFLTVSLSVKSLNAIALPYVGMQLGTYLVIQGSVLAFAVILYLLTRAAASRG
jgi:putative solute:sodium symporter small subunit